MESAFPRNIPCGAHDWGPVLMFVGESCLLFRSFTSIFAARNSTSGNSLKQSGSSPCGGQSQSRAENRAPSSLLRDNSRCPRLARLDSFHRAIPFTL